MYWIFNTMCIFSQGWLWWHRLLVFEYRSNYINHCTLWHRITPYLLDSKLISVLMWQADFSKKCHSYLHLFRVIHLLSPTGVLHLWLGDILHVCISLKAEESVFTIIAPQSDLMSLIGFKGPFLLPVSVLQSPELLNPPIFSLLLKLQSFRYSAAYRAPQLPSDEQGLNLCSYKYSFVRFGALLRSYFWKVSYIAFIATNVPF